MTTTRKRLGDLLVEAGIISEEQLQETLADKVKGQKTGDALLQKGFITEQQLIEVLEFQLGIPHVSLYRYPFETNLFHLIPKDTAKRTLMIPLKTEGDRLFVAMNDPLDFYAIEDLRLATGFKIEPAIATKDDILKVINKYYDLEEGFEELFREEQVQVDEPSVTDAESPIVRLVNQILSNAVTQKASDIHIDPQETKVAIRFRVDGILRTERNLPKHMQSMLLARLKIMANLDITEFRVPQDGRMKANIDVHPIDLRVSTLPTVYGEKIVLRLLDLGSQLNDLQKLGFNKVNHQRFMNMIKQPTGIVLITGPTGSGKSSTLYAALNHLNSEEVNIITVEDPVEYQLEGINQISVNQQVGLTFAKGLRAILRQDPNVIMVGEIRDKETVEVSIRASLTGHLVLSTLHTNDAISTITRLLDMGVEPFLVASSLSGVVAQRLIRRVCRDCKQVVPATAREIGIFAKRGMKIETITRGTGCSSCNMTGYKGRIAIHEILVMNEDMKKVILNDEPISKLRELAVRNKTIFLVDDGLLKVKQGLTTTEEVLRVSIAE
ncbi:GspE/PulE family protein [Rossellomorea marisflavi]|uniref:Type II secretion system protein GspE n=1 Tax=Rossellomorea marisflavi TaxID=189381 RepID=A0A0J5TK41_9BACI|nr:ATPase, T2SS/T4P/T4SS family [Rossellomorea marisflavi]KMK93968.1 type II secretion system protein E [Rossellomorea marisflavi]KML07317.1 type II secretion system protein E [Rossellomorea marisflavi]KML34351.1 type II secretion system protein E [Rossellomorea marisflavi]KZE43550.1 type II secretion system protein GspE [Rossellomorea marisflavi]MCM2606013.1 Flp pilus assembly complex ATPase component TadA [Rossellomorea marisflavi]